MSKLPPLLIQLGKALFYTAVAIAIIASLVLIIFG